MLAKSPELSSAKLVDLALAYESETDEKVWGMLSGVISEIKRFVDPKTPAESALKAICLKLATPMYKKLGTGCKTRRKRRRHHVTLDYRRNHAIR